MEQAEAFDRNQYQFDVANHIRASKQRTVFADDTGTGKTNVGVIWANFFVSEGKRGLWLVHTEELVNQAVERFLLYGVKLEEIGVMQTGDPRNNPGAKIQIVTRQTLSARPRNEWPPAAWIVIDEAHHACSEQYLAILKHYGKHRNGLRRAVRVLGLTATPCRLDGKPLDLAFEAMVVGPGAKVWTERGVLAKVRAFGPPPELMPELGDVKKQRGDYQQAGIERAMMRPKLVAYPRAEYEKHCPGEVAAVYCVTIAHAEAVLADFVAGGHSAEIVTGETDKEHRRALLQRLRSGKTKVVVNVNVLTEGWDADLVTCIIIARPTLSIVLHNQMIGRGIRRFGDRELTVLDHAGNVQRHGLPADEVYEWSLHAPARRKAGATRNEMARKRCPACGELVAVLAAGCDACGEVLRVAEPETTDGELVEIAKRQTVCAGWNGSCPKQARPSKYAFKRCAVVTRKGGPWRCLSCASKKAHAELTPAARLHRSESTRKYISTVPKQILRDRLKTASLASRARWNEMLPEERRLINQKRSISVKESISKWTEEQKLAHSKAGSDAMTPERRRAAATRAATRLNGIGGASTFEERSVRSRNALRKIPTEQRSNNVRKAWETRRANQAAREAASRPEPTPGDKEP